MTEPRTAGRRRAPGRPATSRPSPRSTPGSSTSTTRSTRATRTSSPRSTGASATTSQRLLEVDADEAHRIQKDYYRRYGTTLRGLMEEHGIAPDDFLEYVHDIDHSPIEPDPAARGAIAALPGRKFIFTNGSRRACREGRRAARLHRPFRRHLRHRPLGARCPSRRARPTTASSPRPASTPARAAMFEDLSRNLEVPAALGMGRCWWCRQARARCSRTTGRWRAATRPMSITSPTTSAHFSATWSPRSDGAADPPPMDPDQPDCPAAIPGRGRTGGCPPDPFRQRYSFGAG